MSLNNTPYLFPHRTNVYWNAEDWRKAAQPISVIIVTLATLAFEHLYETRRSSFTSAIEVVLAVVEDMPNHIDRRNGEFIIANPRLPTENFADKWNVDEGTRFREFSRWHKRLEEDLEALLLGDVKSADDARIRSVFGNDGVEAWKERLKHESEELSHGILAGLLATDPQFGCCGPVWLQGNPRLIPTESITPFQTAIRLVETWFEAHGAGLIRKLTHPQNTWALCGSYRSLEGAGAELRLPADFPAKPARIHVGKSFFLKLPHVEHDGSLCLPDTSSPKDYEDPVSAVFRVIQSFEEQWIPMRSDPQRVQEEFQKECLSYWNNYCSARRQSANKLLFSKGLHCIGLWHSHPEPVPSPSQEDLELAADYTIAAKKAVKRHHIHHHRHGSVSIRASHMGT